MKIIDSYATLTGSKIASPYIYESYFPLNIGKYITIQSHTQFDSRNYSYWQEVIDALIPILQKNKISLLQVGVAGDPTLMNIDSIIGKTTINQLAHVIKNSVAHIGPDSLCTHLASYYDKPIVALFSSNHVEISKPVFGNPKNLKAIESYLREGNKKPSFSSNESPKTINLIKPEEICKALLDLLQIEDNSNLKSTHFGENFASFKLEIVPDFEFYVDKALEKPLNIRVDLLDSNTVDEKNISYILTNLSRRKCRIFSDKKFDISFLNNPICKKNLEGFIFYVKDSDDDTKSFINSLIKIGVNCNFLFHDSLKGDSQKMSNLKLDLIDICQVYKNVEKHTEEKQKEILAKINKSSFYKSYRIIYSNGATYISEAALKENAPTKSFYQSLNDIKNLDFFLKKDYDNIYLFDK